MDAGEFLVLVGPSGCGKSTLLNMIAGLDTVSEGEIRIGGRRVNDLHPSERDIAMVFQSYALYPNMSVKENIAFGMEMRKVPKPEREQAVKEVSKTLQIDHLLDRRPAQLSGGQRQRVAMGRALVRKPRIFLFDEPLSNLDAQLRVDMRTEIKKLHQRLGATIVYVTHDQIEAMTLATRIAVMRAGELLQLGSPAEIYNRPANTFVAGFMGSPRMNLIPGTLKSEASGLHLEVAADGAVPARVVLPQVPEATRAYVGREITAGLRPEAISDKLDSGGADGRPVDRGDGRSHRADGSRHARGAAPRRPRDHGAAAARQHAEGGRARPLRHRSVQAGLVRPSERRAGRVMDWDVVIIGSGVGGGCVAPSLADTGARILILERGERLPREPQNWDPEAVFVENRYRTTETWYDGAGNAFRPGQFYYVGGHTKVYGTAMFRFRERDFEGVEHAEGATVPLADPLCRARTLVRASRARVRRTRQSR